MSGDQSEYPMDKTRHPLVPESQVDIPAGSGDTWRHSDGSVREDHMDARPGDYFGPALDSTAVSGDRFARSDALIAELEAAGYTLVRAKGLRHGDVLRQQIHPAEDCCWVLDTGQLDTSATAVSGDRRTALVVALYEDRRAKGADWNVPDVMAVIDRQLDGSAITETTDD